MTPAEVNFITAAGAALALGGYSLLGTSLLWEFRPGVWAGGATMATTYLMAAAAMAADYRTRHRGETGGQR